MKRTSDKTGICRRELTGYLMRSIRCSLKARIKVGSGMKPTLFRYFGALPPSGETAQSRKRRIASAICASGWWLETCFDHGRASDARRLTAISLEGSCKALMAARSWMGLKGQWDFF
jgi:hypothetical protein